MSCQRKVTKRKALGEHLTSRKERVDDEPWSLIEPLPPGRAPRDRRYAGRKPALDRALLNGIVFVLRPSIDWNLRPQEIGWGSGTGCWRRPVACTRSLAAHPRDAAGRAAASRPTRYGTRHRRQRFSSHHAGGKNRPEFAGSAQARQQARPHRRRARFPVRVHPDPLEAPRHHSARRTGGRNSSRSRQARTSSALAACPHVGMSVRLRAASAAPARALHHAVARPDPRAPSEWAGQNAPGRRAFDCYPHLGQPPAGVWQHEYDTLDPRAASASTGSTPAAATAGTTAR
ncbi:transposase [Burkholderia contaminans]|uniref:Transposase n=1 Tax=Burkholderia contaminans TaxID=488447 RepID=A0AAP1VAU3_9BURK|nr:transposase [Burkholderia contaminans]MBA9840198.1 transposase [Burkholderia contaminans]MBA9865229.1 transposase [Burkholderia contaminans]MBA9908112.1 transposase [Burkholderia contaminans]MBA9931702.1 transposase [Burkholderia contaminans]